jgi:nucleoside-diphosphate-sugar epimerase
MRNVLVTGGAGFIGHHLVGSLSKTDSTITVIDNLSNANVNFLRGVKNAIESRGVSRSRFVRLSSKRHGHGGVSMYVEDIRNKESLIEIFKTEEIDTCVHLAAKISVPESITNPGDTIDVNIKGTFNVLEACSKVDVKNFVFASSSAVYGEAKAFPISEEQQLDPLSPYGASKIAGEALISSFKNTGKIQDGVSLRMFNVFGEGQSSEYAGVISRFADRLSANLPPVIYGDGNQTRDFIFIDDVVNAMLLAAKVDKQEKSYPGIFNVGTGRATKIKDLAQMITKIFALDLEPIFGENRKGDIVKSVADISRLKTDLGFVPAHEMEKSLKKMFIKC